MKHLPNLRLVTTAVLLTLASACTSVTFRQQDLAFDFDAKSDSLTLEIEYLDVGPVDYTSFFGSGEGKDSELRLTTAQRFVERVANGAPTFIAFFPHGDWDLDRLARDDDFDLATRTFLQGIEVTEARADVTLMGKLNLYQRIEVPNLSAGLTQFNTELRTMALSMDLEWDEGGSPAAVLENRNMEIFIADAKAGKDWITWTAAGLELRIPACSEYSLTILRDILHEAGAAKGDEVEEAELLSSLYAVGQFLDAAKDLRIEAEHLVLTLGDTSGDLAFTFMGGILADEPDHREGFVQYLKDQGMTFPAIYAKGE